MRPQRRGLGGGEVALRDRNARLWGLGLVCMGAHRYVRRAHGGAGGSGAAGGTAVPGVGQRGSEGSVGPAAFRGGDRCVCGGGGKGGGGVCITPGAPPQVTNTEGERKSVLRGTVVWE